MASHPFGHRRRYGPVDADDRGGPGPAQVAGFGGEFFLALLVAPLPSAIFALTGPEQRRVLVRCTVHVVLVVALALLYLIGTGPFGFIYALLLYFAALATSIVATVDR